MLQFRLPGLETGNAALLQESEEPWSPLRFLRLHPLPIHSLAFTFTDVDNTAVGIDDVARELRAAEKF